MIEARELSKRYGSPSDFRTEPDARSRLVARPTVGPRKDIGGEFGVTSDANRLGREARVETQLRRGLREDIRHWTPEEM